MLGIEIFKSEEFLLHGIKERMEDFKNMFKIKIKIDVAREVLYHEDVF